jgi:hypothetical protein
MIEMNRTYKTRDGREVRIYAVDGSGEHSVHGSTFDLRGWASKVWRRDGSVTGCGLHDGDLIEVKPRIKRGVWIVTSEVPPGTTMLFKSKPDAESLRGWSATSCKPLTIDCEEGEGL